MFARRPTVRSALRIKGKRKQLIKGHYGLWRNLFHEIQFFLAGRLPAPYSFNRSAFHASTALRSLLKFTPTATTSLPLWR